LARRQLTLDNTVAAELAGSEDAVLRELEGRIGCDLHLRGNVLTLDGDEGEVRDAAAVVEELLDLIERGHEVAPATIDTVAGAMDASQRPAEILDDVIWRHRSIQGRSEDRQPEALRGLDPPAHGHLRNRPRGELGKTFLAVAMAVAALTLER
jgi:phosphate starvation-inducible PhoH-like protein